MATRMNGSLRLCGAAIGGLVVIATVPPALAQWAPPLGGPSPVQIELSLEAQGYGLIAPLVRRPGVYLADVNAGPAGYQRLILDARSGQILERFVAPGEVGAPSGKFAHDGQANLDLPFGARGYDYGDRRTGAKPRAKGLSTERKAPFPVPKPASGPPLPPPAPREATRQEGSGSAASGQGKAPESTEPNIPVHSMEADKAAPAALRTESPPADGNDKAKVSIVPPAAFE
jgi:hypothetical protein